VSLAITRGGGHQTVAGRDGNGATLGFRRIDLVRIVVDGECTTAEVTGVVHRYPRTKRISLATAARLVAAGAPMSLEHRSESR